MKAIEINQDNYKREIQEEKTAILVDFYAKWCGPCQSLGRILEKMEEGWKLCKIDIDENPVLAQQFQIHSVPTLMVMREGKPVSTHVGLCTAEEIQTMMENAPR